MPFKTIDDVRNEARSGLRSKAGTRPLGSSYDTGSRRSSGISERSSLPRPSGSERAPVKQSWWSRLMSPIKYGKNPGFGGAAPGRSIKKSQMSQTEGY